MNEDAEQRGDKKKARAKPSHIIPGVPGGNAQLDPEEQPHRRDMEGDPHNGPRDSYRGSLPPGTPAKSSEAKTTAVRDDERALRRTDESERRKE